MIRKIPLAPSETSRYPGMRGNTAPSSALFTRMFMFFDTGCLRWNTAHHWRLKNAIPRKSGDEPNKNAMSTAGRAIFVSTPGGGDSPDEKSPSFPIRCQKNDPRCSGDSLCPHYRLENWGARRAFLSPYFFRSFIRGSRVKKSARFKGERRSGSTFKSARAIPWRMAPA